MMWRNYGRENHSSMPKRRKGFSISIPLFVLILIALIFFQYLQDGRQECIGGTLVTVMLGGRYSGLSYIPVIDPVSKQMVPCTKN